MTSPIDRQRRFLEESLGDARRRLDTCNRAIAAHDDLALRMARETTEAAILGYADALAQHTKSHPNAAELTPVMSTSASQQLRAASRSFEAANAALKEGKH